jgi:hypothetical protein
MRLYRQARMMLRRLFHRANQETNMIERVRPRSESSPVDRSPVRGRPFKHGNPGRPPGSKNKLTRLLEELFENEGETLARKHIELAKGGNVRCLEYLLDRLVPKRPGRPLDVQLLPINSVHDIAPAAATITNKLNAGDLTLEEASRFFHLLADYAEVIKTNNLAIKVEQLELQVEQMKKLKGREDLIR